MTNIEIFNESGIDIPVNEEVLTDLADRIARGENCTFSLLECVYVDEARIREVNQTYLEKEYVTDIITFTYSDETDDNPDVTDTTELEGTLYMCAQRISEQAEELGIAEIEEYKRVFIHGLLHLCGFDDKDEASKSAMTDRENIYLKNEA